MDELVNTMLKQIQNHQCNKIITIATKYGDWMVGADANAVFLDQFLFYQQLICLEAVQSFIASPNEQNINGKTEKNSLMGSM